MKSFIILFVLVLNTQAYAIDAKDCPDSVYIRLFDIRIQEEIPTYDKYDVISLVSTSNGQCNYEGVNKTLKATIEGNLNDKIKNPALMRIVFESPKQKKYTATVMITGKNSNNKLNFSSIASINENEAAPVGDAFFGYGYDLTIDLN